MSSSLVFQFETSTVDKMVRNQRLPTKQPLDEPSSRATIFTSKTQHLEAMVQGPSHEIQANFPA